MRGAASYGHCLAGFAARLHFSVLFPESEVDVYRFAIGLVVIRDAGVDTFLEDGLFLGFESQLIEQYVSVDHTFVYCCLVLIIELQVKLFKSITYII